MRDGPITRSALLVAFLGALAALAALAVVQLRYVQRAELYYAPYGVPALLPVREAAWPELHGCWRP